jgi:hypothetical protein
VVAQAVAQNRPTVADKCNLDRLILRAPMASTMPGRSGGPNWQCSDFCRDSQPIRAYHGISAALLRHPFNHLICKLDNSTEGPVRRQGNVTLPKLRWSFRTDLLAERGHHHHCGNDEVEEHGHGLAPCVLAKFPLACQPRSHKEASPMAISSRRARSA